MSLLMNAANIVVRRIIKNYDDQVTEHDISNLCDWNMQFSEKPYIKGDLRVDSRGSSVLLVREVQAQNLMALALNFSAHPVFGPLMKPASLARSIAKAHMLSADEFILIDEELKNAAEAADQGAEKPPRTMAAEMQQKSAIELAGLNHKNKMEELDKAHQTEMVRAAAQMNLSLAELKAKLADKAEARASQERQFAAELATPVDKCVAIS